MKRLTYIDHIGWYIEDQSIAFDEQRRGLDVDRLAAYEDAMSLERAQELAEAEKDGRLVVLPCKVGDNVKVDVNSWGNVWNYKTYDFGKFLYGEIVSISIIRKQILMKIRVEHNVNWERPMRRYPISALGKTVFLSREEAEVALKKREEDA